MVSRIRIKSQNGRPTPPGLVDEFSHCGKDIIKLFLDSDKEIDFNARMDYYSECTAFIFACSVGSTDVVELLLTHSDGKIDLNAKDKYGCTAFLKACSYMDTKPLFN